jgi:hypothetical protein
MYAVKGIYEGGDLIKLNHNSIPVHEPYNVIITFLEPAPEAEAAETKDDAQRKKAFANWSKYHKTLPADFDYQKKLTETLNEKYDRAAGH